MDPAGRVQSTDDLGVKISPAALTIHVSISVNSTILGSSLTRLRSRKLVFRIRSIVRRASRTGESNSRLIAEIADSKADWGIGPEALSVDVQPVRNDRRSSILVLGGHSPSSSKTIMREIWDEFEKPISFLHKSMSAERLICMMWRGRLPHPPGSAFNLQDTLMQSFLPRNLANSSITARAVILIWIRGYL